MNNNETTEAHESSWRKTIRQAAEAAKEYAKAVADDYADEWRQADEAERADAARRAASAFDQADDWYRTADKLIEALDDNQSDEDAAQAIRDEINRASGTTQADWCCPIADELGKAATEALAEATASEAGYETTMNKASAAARLAEAYAEAVRWG
jgi:hypothetical protein